MTNACRVYDERHDRRSAGSGTTHLGSPPLVDATAQACVEQKQALVDCYRDAQAGGGPGACKEVAEVFLACSRKARAAKVGQGDEGQGDEGRAAKVDGAAAG